MSKRKITSNFNRQITKISIDSDLAVSIGFSEIVPNSGSIIDPSSMGNGTEDEDEEVDLPAKAINHSVDSPWRPHSDFLDAMKGLKKFATDICEMPGLKDFNVIKIKIDGDFLLKQSRVVLTIGKNVKRSDKVIKFNTPQVTMYGESEYSKASEMSKQLEVVIDEAWAYIGGKYSEEEGKQLPLFARQELELA